MGFLDCNAHDFYVHLMLLFLLGIYVGYSLNDVPRDDRRAMLDRMKKTKDVFEALNKTAQVTNITVKTYDAVFRNILSYTHDSTCFKKDSTFIATKLQRDMSFAFNINFPTVLPRVFVSLAGVKVLKKQSDLELLSFQEIPRASVYNDHFSLTINIDKVKTQFEMLQICYYATVNLIDYIPPM